MRWLSLLAVGLVAAGCTGVDGRHYTFRTPAEIDTTRLRLDGYYVTARPWRYSQWSADEQRVVHESGMYLQPLVLWRDGTAALSHLSWSLTDEEIAAGRDPLLMADSVVVAISPEREPYGPTAWGAFRLDGDSLQLQVLVSPVGLSPMATWAFSGRVLSDTSFVLNDLYVGGRRDTRWGTGTRDNPSVFVFRPFAPLPPRDNWTDTHPKLQPDTR